MMKNLGQIQRLTAPVSIGAAALKSRLTPDARMQECDHRIKNHLQLIGSSLSIQARGCAHAESRELLLQAYGRISAVARLHARFQNMAGLRRIQIADLLNEICADLSICFNATREASVELEVDVQPRAMEAGDALTVGLIVNELVTNAVKHGPNDDGRLVCVVLRQEGKRWRLTVRDNGPGVTPDIFNAGSSLGVRLLHALAAQIGGALRVDTVSEGASISVVFG